MATQGNTTAINLQIICRDHPALDLAGQIAEFGLQDKQQQLQAGVGQPDGTMHFTCAVQARVVSLGQRPDFMGPFVHGKPGDRFLYLGYRVQGTASWIRRWKLSLDGIRADHILSLSAQPGQVLCAVVSLIGGATIRPLGNEWTIELA